MQSKCNPLQSAGEIPRAPRADFDGDGCGDLAIGVLSEDVGSPRVDDAGTVNVIR